MTAGADPWEQCMTLGGPELEDPVVQEQVVQLAREALGQDIPICFSHQEPGGYLA